MRLSPGNHDWGHPKDGNKINGPARLFNAAGTSARQDEAEKRIAKTTKGGGEGKNYYA